MALSFKSYNHPTLIEVPIPYSVVGVSYDALETDEITGLPKRDYTARVDMVCQQDGTRLRIPLSMNSIQATLGIECRRASESTIANLRENQDDLRERLAFVETIRKNQASMILAKKDEILKLETLTHQLESKISQLEFSNNSYIKKAEDDRKEIHRLEGVCCKWYGEVGQQATKIAELQTSGAAKERDEYSKALQAKEAQYEKTIRGTRDSLLAVATEAGKLNKANALLSAQLNSNQSHLQTKFEQATKEAKKWKETATIRAAEIDRLANLVIQRTNERNEALGKPEQVSPYPEATITFGNSAPIPVQDLKIAAGKSMVTKPSAQLKELPAVTAAFKWDQGWGLPATIAGPTLVDRVSTLEAQVEKLEKPAKQQYRLLDPKEKVEKGDEFRQNDRWIESSLAGMPQQYGVTYRRKVQ